MTTLHLLILEDNPYDAELEVITLQEAGYECHWERVETKEAFLDRLHAASYDLILADYSLPSFDGLMALELCRQHAPDLPFILISGTLGEEIAIESLKAGATDYVLKDRLSRLEPAVRRSLREREAQQRRRQMAEALHSSEAKYRTLFNSVADPIFIFDRTMTRFLDCNQSALDRYGYSLQEFRAMRPHQLHPDKEWDRVDRNIAAERDDFPHYYTHITKDGHKMHVEVHTAALEYQGQEAWVSIVRDISARRQAEHALLESNRRLEEALNELQTTQQKMIQQERLAAVGQLAAGIAHDFNNILTVIQGYTEFAVESISSENELYLDLLEVKKAADQATALTNQLLVFSRKQVLQLQELNLNDVIGSMKKMLGRVIGEDIVMTTSLAPDLGWMRADLGQIEQVIMNLVINARDAMPQGGKLVLETANVALDQVHARKHLEVRPGEYVMLAVSDTGEGMSPEVQSRIFEPFFTTKEKGKGTGLGLSTVYGIVTQSGGGLGVYSEQGIGTTFKIYLPRVYQEPQVEKQTRDTPGVHRGAETILLVEDEESVRGLVRRVLQRQGYRVLEAERPSEAFHFCQQFKGQISLLITDVVMPEVGGRELAKQLLLECPHLKVLYMSGYTGDAIARHGILDTGEILLQKPFTPDALARKVREVLDE